MEGKSPKAKAKGKHRWNSCGSEAERDERKRTDKPSTKNRERKYGKPDWKERGKPRKRKWRGRTEEATVRRRREERGKEETEAE